MTGRYVAVLFADLERHSVAWSRIPREQMVAVIAEYRYVAESLASQYGCLYLEWAGDGHMFLFESADAGARFAVKLVETWKRTAAAARALRNVGHMPIRIGCHFGECTPLGDGQGWIGRCNSVAKRVEAEAEPDALYVTETMLDLLDLPVYRFEPVGTHTLKGDHLPQRILYRITAFDRAALDAKPREELTAEDWFLRGVGLIGTDRENSEEEAESYREALRLRPEYAEAHNNLAIVLRTRGDVTSAAEHYREALRVRPDYPEAHYNYAALLAARGSFAGAETNYREALRLRPDYADAHHGLANLLVTKGELEAAVAHYEEALRLRPEYAEAHSNYALALEQLGRLDAAVEQHEEALRIRPNNPIAHYNYALLLETRGDAAAAEQRYRDAVRLWPEYGEAHNNLAILLQLRGETAQAERHYVEALKARPDDPETHYNYALLLRRRGDSAGAQRHFRIAYELAPDVPAFRSALESPS